MDPGDERPRRRELRRLAEDVVVLQAEGVADHGGVVEDGSGPAVSAVTAKARGLRRRPGLSAARTRWLRVR